MTSVDSGLPPPPSETTALLAPVDHESPGSSTFLSVFRRDAKMLLRPALPVFWFVCSTSASRRTFSSKPMGSTHSFEHSIFMSSVTFIEHISAVALAAATIGFVQCHWAQHHPGDVQCLGHCPVERVDFRLATIHRTMRSTHGYAIKLLYERRCLPLMTVVLQILILIVSPVCWLGAS